MPQVLLKHTSTRPSRSVFPPTSLRAPSSHTVRRSKVGFQCSQSLMLLYCIIFFRASPGKGNLKTWRKTLPRCNWWDSNLWPLTPQSSALLGHTVTRTSRFARSLSQLYCPCYTRSAILPLLHSLSYTALASLAQLYCPRYTRSAILPLLHSLSYCPLICQRSSPTLSSCCSVIASTSTAAPDCICLSNCSQIVSASATAPRSHLIRVLCVNCDVFAC